MLKIGNLRFCVKPNRLPSIDDLARRTAQFPRPLDDIGKQVALCMETEDRLELMPILLLGDPGIGKTHFAKALARLFGTAYQYVAMSSLTAGWVLSGASSQWKNAKPGKVFETLVNGSYANPVIVVDEIDKANRDSQYDPLGALYALLEHETARGIYRRIRRNPDQCRTCDLDRYRQRRPLHSGADSQPHERLRNSRRPTKLARGTSHRPSTMRSARRIAGAGGFPGALGDDALDALAHASPRDMRRTILQGFGAARVDGRDEVRADDIRLDRATRRRPIGF